MKIPVYALIVAVFMFCLDGYAQPNPYVDSLNKAAHTQNSQQMFDSYFRVIDAYRMNDRFEEAISTANTYKHIAQQQGNKLEIVKAYALLTQIFINKEDYKTGQIYLDSVVLLGSDSKDIFVRAYTNYAKMTFYYGIGDNEQLTRLAQETLALIESDGKDKFLEAKCNYYLYSVYTLVDDFAKSQHYARLAIANAKEAGEFNLLSSAYMALGTAYSDQYQAQKKALDLDSVFYYTRLAGTLYFQYPGHVSDYTYCISKLNEANYELQFFYPQQLNVLGKIKDSIQSVLTFVNTQVRTGRNSITTNCYGMLATIARLQHDFPLAKTYLDSALEKANNSVFPLYYQKCNIYKDLTQLYYEQGDYKNAYETQKKLLESNAELFDNNKTKVISQLDAQYQAEKKEKELQVLKEQAKNQKRIQYLYLGLAAIGIGGMFFMFRSYHFKLKYSLEHRKKLEVEKHDAHSRILLQEEEQARLKAEQELLEFQQQKLRDEVMMSQLQVQHKNEVLQNLKEKLHDETPVNIQQIIRDESLLDSDFENAKFRIQEVHPNFFKILNDLSTSRLTSLDLKYCAYIYLSMDTKQIAQLLNVEPKSVRMTKYRLKQKFGLEKEMDLTTFLKGIG